LPQFRESKYHHPNSGIKVIPIVSPEARSLGDAMRELDARQLITSDFILITGDVVSTLRIDQIVREHKERRKGADKDAIMTMVFKPLSARDRPRCITF
jgi:translation initiation factor eIF-2B subunit epsilon